MKTTTRRGSLTRRDLLTVAAATALSVGLVRAPARAAEFSWKYGSPYSAGYGLNVRMVQAFARIRSESKGRLDIQPYLNSSLGSPGDMVQQLRLGALEIFCNGGAGLDNLVPIASIDSVAFAFPTRESAFAAMDGDLGRLMRSEFPSKGLIVLERAAENGYRQFTTNTRAIRTVEDLQGLKLRVSPGKLALDTFQSLGASSTPMSVNEIYTSLQTHIIDAQESPLVYIEDQRFFEVQKYCSLTNHVWGALWTLISQKRWDELPTDVQEIVRRNLNRAALLQRRDNALSEGSVRDKLRRQGLAFNQPSAEGFKAKLRSSGYYARWRTQYGETGWKALEKYTGALN